RFGKPPLRNTHRLGTLAYRDRPSVRGAKRAQTGLRELDARAPGFSVRTASTSTTASIRSQGEDRTRISCKAFSPERCVLVRDDVKMKQVWHLCSPSSALHLNCFSREWLDRRFGARHRAVVAEGSPTKNMNFRS